MAKAEGIGFSLDFSNMGVDLASGPDMTVISKLSEPQSIECAVNFDPPIFPPESLMCTGFDQYEITCPPTERQLKRYRRKMRRNKKRGNKTRRRNRDYTRPKGAYYKQEMKITNVDYEGDKATISMISI